MNKKIFMLICAAIVALSIGSVESQELAPVFSLTDIDGSDFSLTDYSGKVVLLNFFATWCGGCIEEIPHLKSLKAEFGEDLIIISISVDFFEDVETLQQFRDDNDIEWIVARDTIGVNSEYNVQPIPALFVIDQEGYIQHQHEGLTDESLLREEISEIVITGSFSTKMNAINPETGNKQFTFYSNDTSVGSLFNVTIRVRNATALYGWRAILTYNHCWLNATRVIKPEGDAACVFYGEESNMDYVLNEGAVEINETSADAEPFEGSGILAVIEFEILSLATNETGDLRGDLTLDESRVFTGATWQSVLGEKTGCWMIYGAESEDDGPRLSWLESYWPYLVALIVAMLVAYLAIRRLRKRREPPV